MYSPFQLAAKYLHYYLTASNGKGHGMHSPYLFQFITKILNDQTVYPDYATAEALRQQLKNDHTLLRIEDLGAGSGGGNHTERKVSSIARLAAKPRKYGQLLYRIARANQPATILELGTSLGITSTYLALARPEAKLVTLEGATAVAAKAREQFSRLQLSNITLVEGNFDQTLQPVLKQLAQYRPQPLDLVFIDGNHRQEPTERYFTELLPYTHNDTILVFDDIHWSREMEQAWQTIRSHPEVRCTADLFFIGLVFFRREFREKQHFAIRF